MPPSQGLAHLLARMRIIEARIRTLVATRRQDDPTPDDPFRGLYLSDAAVDRVLAAASTPLTPDDAAAVAECDRLADAAERDGDGVRLRDLARTFGLDPLDVDLLLVALAGDLDPRFEQLFGYLNDDVTRRRPSVATALALCGQPVASASARARLVDGPLVRGGLIEVDDPERPFPGRALRVPDRVSSYLLGDDAPDTALAGVMVDLPEVEWGDAAPLTAALEQGVTFCYLNEPPTGSARAVAARALAACGRPALAVDLARIAEEPNPLQVARIVAREARLLGAGLVAGPVTADALRPPLVAALQVTPGPLLFVGEVQWDPAWAEGAPLQMDIAPSTRDERTRIWHDALDGSLPAEQLEPAIAQFLLRPEQVVRAARSALVQSRLTGVLAGEQVQAGARAENGSALQHLARRVHPTVGWDDLVLPPTTKSALMEVALRARHRERVLGEWHMRPGGGRGMGVAALFAGDSGTGKTMSAEVVAAELGLDLYVVDLATVVDKYVGETEKNLEKIFGAAAGVNGVLLFDEADAVFGKRSEVKDAHDRYANVESAYLLQRMESFDGLAILATNLRANIDDAFTRRLDVLVDFPMPDAEYRLALWDTCLGTVIARADDVDLSFCAKAFELAGGAIRAAAVTAAYLAADDDGPITMLHLITAVQREYRKMGRLLLEHEFGPYYSLLV